MSVQSANTGARPATVEYADQLEKLRALQLADRRRDRWFGIAKLVVAGCALAAGVFALHNTLAVELLLVLIAGFVWLLVVHERLLQRIAHRALKTHFYESGVARLNGNWAGRGATGERYMDPSHVYARDLDLFGRASVFEYLSTARTRSGEDTLARWLTEPGALPLDEILARQAAVRDLAGRLKFREELATVGETVRSEVHPEALAAWGERGPSFTSRLTRVTTTMLAVMWIAGVAWWIVSGSPVPALMISVLNFAFAHWLHPKLDLAAGAIEKAADDLRLISTVLMIVERETFTAPLLVEMQSRLKRNGEQPSRAIRRLAGLSETIQSRHSLFARPLDLVTFWSAQLVFIAERWQRDFGPLLRVWLAAVGELEALTSLATFTYEHPEYTFPEFVREAPWFVAEGIAHPLLSAATTVENDLTLGTGCQLMILSGPNMAGKSTFIRSLGVNAVLAQCGAPVRARRLRMSPLRVAASICILDSLSGGTSRFYAEIQRVKVIADLAEGPVSVLFLLDELLSGTNSHDRFVGTEFVLQMLLERKAIGIVSTHDLALTRIPDSMEGRAFNAHFEDKLEDGELIFDYKLKPGIVQTSNALKLMRSIGFGVSEQ
jgi:hypothetical protein